MAEVWETWLKLIAKIESAMLSDLMTQVAYEGQKFRVKNQYVDDGIRIRGDRIYQLLF